MNKLMPLIFTVILIIAACGSPQQIHEAAPLNDKIALEKLASAYEAAAETIPVSPTMLNPEARKRFVEKTFNDAGYSYSATLLALSKVKPDTITQYHRDMKQLLLLPHYGIPFEETKHIYTAQEIQAIQTINQVFK